MAFPELEIDMEGLKTVVEIYAEQTGMKGPLPNPEKYVDMSYLKASLEGAGLEMIPIFMWRRQGYD